ncbi:hypothetical protein [Vibrio crassostreae]|uniref:hypothetical protein n=1 Tax=Vibrio crassostreae TaxID=246167 RepID=UPI001B308526|nr:hypothetical protein [Vibrio crassostreae]
MSFLNKVLDGVGATNQQQNLTLDAIREAIEEDYEFTVNLFHGSKNFQGNSVDLSKAGSVGDRQNDAHGTGFYMTASEEVAGNYAGDSGQIVKGEVVLTEDNTSNFLMPMTHPEMIERAVLECPRVYQAFSNHCDLGAPYYDIDEETYECPETGEDVHCSLDTYLATFGGIQNVFASPMYRPKFSDANNPVDDFIAEMMEQDTLYDALYKIECALYTTSGEQDQESVQLANQLNEIKSDYGVELGIAEDNGNLIFVITDGDAVDVKEVVQLKPKPSSPKLR